ncbi:Translation initiation factor IF-2 (fragment) [Methylocella tundrae]|uniref:Translation initiation factor IF-2 n=1 Tax=Methylocella tundrae TaxID=227605 RepID=A0A4V6IMU3_METTU
MSETKNPGDHTLSVSPTKTLSLKRPVEAGIVRQSFSHGRSKAVVVEKVKRRALGSEPHPLRESAAPEPAQPAVAPQPPRPQQQQKPQRPQGGPPRSSSGVILRSLTEEEREARSRALSGAHEREIEERKRAEIEAKAREEREAREREERAAAEARKREEEARRVLEAESKRRSEQEAKRRLAGGEPAPAPTGGAPRKAPAPSRRQPQPRRRARQPRRLSQTGRPRRRRPPRVGRGRRGQTHHPPSGHADEGHRRSPGQGRRAKEPRPSHCRQRDGGRRRAHALDRGLPPPHPAAEGPCQRDQGKAGARSRPA